ncbi:prolipoprotein diacylglyceryl transferase family protein [Paraburkholderia sp. GAS334]|uniref:prolipoprotein diacylglyceryl transferase family protein n=1 Tax=Paraburkholderia sp. GAS334 TaxID=3035131 RepID=UPI003D1F262D
MNIGPLSLPIGPIIFFLSVAIAIFAGWLIDKGRRDTDPVIFAAVIIGLIVARISFVLQYLPSYQDSLFKILDFRDTGFEPLPGVVAGLITIGLVLARRKSIRRPSLLATVVGLAVWGVASAATGLMTPSSTVPDNSLFNAAGTSQPLAPHDGKPHVINLWATWCAPCQAEMPILANAQAGYPGLDLVFVNQGERPNTVDSFMANLNLHVNNSLFDPSLSVAKATGTKAFPTTLFYDASGRLLESHLGRFSEATLEATISHLYPGITTRRAK